MSSDAVTGSTVHINEGKAVLTLDATLNIAASASLHNELKTALQTGFESLAIDASAVQSADTASLQLLLSLVKTAASQLSVQISWQSVSESLAGLVKMAGLQQQLQLEQEPA